MKHSRGLMGGMKLWTLLVSLFFIVACGSSGSSSDADSEEQVVAQISLGLDPAEIEANGTDTTNVTATVLDGSGNPISGEPVSFSLLGQVSDTTADDAENASSSVFSDTGQKVTASFTSQGGLTTFTMDYEGSGNFNVWLWSEDTESRVDLLVNEIGAVDAAQSVQTLSPGDYFFEVSADASDKWSIAIDGTIDGYDSGIDGTGTLQDVINTDASGHAVFQYSGSTEKGQYTISAEAGGITQSIVVSQIAGPAVNVQLFADTAAIYANGGGSNPVSARVTDIYGNLVEDGTVVFFTASGGTVSAQAKTVEGIAKPELTSSLTAGTSTVTATIDGVDSIDTDTIAIVFEAISFAGLTADPASLPANGEDTTSVSVRLKDEKGRAVAGESIEFSTTGGSLVQGTAVTDENGIATVSLMAPTEKSAATVTAAYGAMTQSMDIDFYSTVQTVDSLYLSTSKTSIVTNGEDTSIVTAHVLDADRVPMEGITVVFKADGGQINAASALTDENGNAAITLSSGSDKKNVLVNITAQAQGKSAAIPVLLSGSTVSLSLGTTTLKEDGSDETTLSVTVKDGGDLPVYGVTVDISQSGTGRITLDTASGETDVNGVFSVVVRGASAGDVELNVTALETRQTQQMVVSGDPFEIISPTLSSISKKTGQQLSIRVNSPDGHNIKFITTMGTWSNAAGEPDDKVLATAGATTITIDPGTTTATAVLNTADITGVATIRVEDAEDSLINDTLFVAISAPSSEAATISLQVSPSVIAPSTGDIDNVAILRAAVRNATGQVVSDAPVIFSLFRTTGGGEYIDPPIVYTNTAGEARSSLASGSLGSDSKGVFCLARIADAAVSGPGNIFSFVDARPGADTIFRSDGGDFTADGFRAGDSIAVSGSSSNDGSYTIAAVTPAMITLVDEDILVTESAGETLVIGTLNKTDVVSVKISQSASSIAIGGATVIEELDSSNYKYPMSVLVADSNGNPVAGTTVNLSVWPTLYYTGYTNSVVGPIRTNDGYPNEDINRNDILDAGEDTLGHPDGADLTAGNGQLDPGRSTAGTVPTTVTTDENGVALFDYVYLKNYAGWLDVDIMATTFVYGSETSSVLNFSLGWMASEAASIPNSPWGKGETEKEPGIMSMTADPSSVPADGVSSSSISVNVSDTNGDPMPWGTVVSLTTTSGTFSNGDDVMDVSIGNDIGSVIVSLISSAAAGFAEVTATVDNLTQRIDVEFEGATTNEMAAIGLVAAQNALNPDTSTTITAMAYDGSGHGLAGQEIGFTLDDPTLGTITAAGTTAADGTFVATFQAGSATGIVSITADSDGVSSSLLEITIKEQFVDTITVTVNPTAVSVTKTASVSAEVLDASSNPVPNATVSFSLQDSAFGTITATAVTNAVGVATSTFVAANFSGVATIAATSGTVSNTVDLDIQPAEAASIEFGTVSTNPIAVRGTGGQEFAVISFNVKDVNGNPAEDVDVLITMVSGMQGGEYLESDDGTPYEQVVGTSAGTAAVTLHSGDEAGTVSITATIITSGGTTISTTTPIISIGGGVVTDEWFVVSVSEPGWNMGGLGCVGIETEITAWLADRFGNYNVLDGHTVSFQTEPGLAVNPIGTTEAGTGSASTTVRTQGVPKDVVPEAWEINLKTQLAIDFGGIAAWGEPLPSGHPRDGVCNLLLFTIGEESFVDGSGGNPLNGVYDAGESFIDTQDDPWRDYDDDGDWDDGGETSSLTSPGQVDPASGIIVNPEEDEYQDRNGNDQWDGLNAEWDGNKNLFRQVDFLITGHPIIRTDKSSFAVANGGFDTVKLLICDKNYNPLSAGSTYTVSVDAGTISGGVESYEYPSSSFYGSETSTDWDGDGDVDSDDYMRAHENLIVNEIIISDADPSKNAAENAELSITVTWKSNGACGDIVDTLTISGTVN